MGPMPIPPSAAASRNSILGQVILKDLDTKAVAIGWARTPCSVKPERLKFR
jgi:hypothetical protein